ncbi:7 TM domain-containing transmembrane protein [Acrasis kona]|uniref:7 TM domain-containing transmembrane protein n=1 Tax=Acrasis kona TaxID=1008807 RepID=A0AAW2ZBX9_9EUKA
MKNRSTQYLYGLLELAHLALCVSYGFYLIPLVFAHKYWIIDSTIVLVLLIGLIYDNFIIAASRNLTNLLSNTSMQKLHFPRYILHSLVLPLCLINLAHYGERFTGSAWFAPPLVVLCLVVLILDVKHLKDCNKLTYTSIKIIVDNNTGMAKAQLFDPASERKDLLYSIAPAIIVTLSSILIGFIIMIQTGGRHWALFAGGLVMLLLAGSPSKNHHVKSLLSNIGELFFMLGYIYTL